MKFKRVKESVRLSCAAIAVLAIARVPAFAQTNLGPADPARIKDRAAPASQEWQKLETAPVSPKAVTFVPEGADTIRFTLRSLTIEGMTAYTDAQVEPFYKEYLGTEISAAILFKIMEGIQQKYLDEGYTLTKVVIPNQKIEDGNARLQVVEGHVSEIEIDPSIKDSPAIRQAREKILLMRPLNTLMLERLLLVLNDLPDLNVSAILASPKETGPRDRKPGSVRLILQRNEVPYSYGDVAFDNHGSVFAGPYQGRVLGRLPHVGLNYSELSALFLGSVPLQEQKFVSLHYALPIFGVSGAKLDLGATVARTEPGSDLDILDVRGQSKSFSAQISYPLIKQRAHNLVIDGGIEFKNSKTDLLDDELYDDRQRIVGIGGSYRFSDSFKGLNIIDLHLYKGLDILGVREKGSDRLSRLDGRPDFTKVNFSAGRLQALPHEFEAYVMLSGQYTAVPLLSSEEFGFGGGSIGRGYNPSEIAGDKGVAVSFEVRAKKIYFTGNRGLVLQPYGFFDIGKVWNIDFGDTTAMSAASAGAGIRFNINNIWDSDVSLAFPLTQDAENPPKYAHEEGPRLLFSLSRKF